jgi:uncharacterized protein YkwD
MRHAAMPLLLATLFAVTAVRTTAQEKKEPPQPTADEKALLELTNKERAKKDLPPLTYNARLREAAVAHSVNMAKQGKLEHELDGKTPGNRADAAGYNFRFIGENIALAENGTNEEIMQGWMESKLHRDNILKKDFKDVGIGVTTDGKGVKYITQLFATPAR